MNRISDQYILALWRTGNDTLEIARAVGLSEPLICSRLHRILERVRQEREGGAA